MKKIIIALAVVASIGVASAQPAQQQIPMAFTPDEVAYIAMVLRKQPYEQVKDLLDKMQAQYLAATKPADPAKKD